MPVGKLSYILKKVGAEKTIISLTGLISYCAYAYNGGLSDKIIKKKSIGDMLRRTSILKQKKLFENLGKYEIDTIRSCKYVSGRTEWDKSFVRLINKKAKYYHCEEIMRKSFYIGRWEKEKIKKYSIFISQGSYPIKGIHEILKILPSLKRYYPEVQVRIAGPNIVKVESMIDKIKITSYGKIIREIIEKNKLQANVFFLGNLNEEQMKNELLKANVFLSTSIIENSSNAIGEAMLLGVPCIAANVGGNSSLITNGIDGYLYPFTEPYMMLHYILEVFDEENQNNVMKISQNAQKRARLRYDIDKAREQLLIMYKDVYKNNIAKERIVD